MKVALTGASGYVGGFVARKLLAQGAEVHALARPDSRRAPDLPVRWIAGELGSAKAAKGLLAGADALVHCAYDHVPGRYRGGEGNDRQRFWRTNLLGSLVLMDEARQAGVRRVVLLSSRAVYGRRTAPAAAVDESVRPLPDTYYGALKLALEAHLGALAEVDGLCAASLRPTGVYGIGAPVARSKWFDLAVALAEGKIPPPPRRATEVHGEDVASAVWLLLTRPAAQVAGRAFNCADLVVDTGLVAARLGELLGRAVSLPPATNTLRHAMRATALRQLGWQPGGEARLAATLEELAALASGAANDATARPPAPL